MSGFPRCLSGKASACPAEDAALILGSERSPEGGHDNPLQCFAWRIPSTEEPGGLQSMGLHRVGHN